MTTFSRPTSSSSFFSRFAAAGLTPLVVAVFLAFMAVAVPLGALALELRERLGASTSTVGWVIGIQSLATLLSRHAAGTFCDQRGPRAAALLGLPLAALSGGAYLLSTLDALGPQGRLAILVAGRLVLGVGESLLLTGLMSWGIARLGAAHTGKVMSWTGIAIYAALGVGAPLGLAVHERFGFAGVALLTSIAPMLAWAIAAALPAVPAAGGQRVAFHRVIGLIWKPGLVLALAMVPFATISAFLALDYRAHGWTQPGLALSGFAAGFIVVRLVASDLPDRVGAQAVAAGSLAFEGLGQLLLWCAPSAALAVAGATLTGLGFSLVFPAMGVIATRSVPPEQRGRAVGNFVAFADIALGVTGPAVGIATHWAGIPSAFLAGTAATCAALGLLAASRPGPKAQASTLHC